MHLMKYPNKVDRESKLQPFRRRRKISKGVKTQHAILVLAVLIANDKRHFMTLLKVSINKFLKINTDWSECGQFYGFAACIWSVGLVKASPSNFAGNTSNKRFPICIVSLLVGGISSCTCLTSIDVGLFFHASCQGMSKNILY